MREWGTRASESADDIESGSLLIRDMIKKSVANTSTEITNDNYPIAIGMNVKKYTIKYNLSTPPCTTR